MRLVLPDRPPYHEIQVEFLARTFAEKKAWWSWFSSHETNHSFAPALRKLGLRPWLGVVESGAVVLFEFAPEGKRYLISDVPLFDTLRWLDVAHARRVLHRVRELEVVGGVRDPMPRKELDSMLDTYEQARIECIPELRRRIAAAEARMQ